MRKSIPSEDPQVTYAICAWSMMGDWDRLEAAFPATEWTDGKSFLVRSTMVRLVVLVSCMAFFGMGTIPIDAQDEWPQWRGPSGQGHAIAHVS